MSANTHVPDKLEGYLLQVRHALFELISLEDKIVSIEAFDDVAVETENTLIAEQTKSVLSGNNPAADRSAVFWKTLKNWCEYIKSGIFPNKSIVLRYVIVATRALNVGSIPCSFAEAKTTDEASAALEAARITLLGDGTEDEPPKLGKQVEEYVDYCFAEENMDTMVEVIANMETDLHEDTYDDELRQRFNRQIIPQEYSENLFVSMLGWVSDQVHEQTKQNKPAYISSEDYRKELEAQVRSRDLRKILTAVSVQPDSSRTTAEVERHDTYIRQLELIDTDTTKLLETASDFLRTRAEKTEWAKQGIVTKQSLIEYHDGLKRIWNNEKTVVNYTVHSDEKGKGQVLLSLCERDSITHRLQGASTPSFFGPGSLHELANEPSSHPTIGWHPRYAELLMEKGDEHNED